MAPNLKKLNNDIRRAKASKKAKPAAEKPAEKQSEDPSDLAVLVQAIRDMKPPVVNVKQRAPVSYKIKVDINSRGDMVGAVLEPMKARG